MNEPWSRVLCFPWVEIVQNVFEAQQIEDEGGAGSQMKLLGSILEALAGK